MKEMELTILKNHNICHSCYHVGNLKGNTIHCLCAKGSDIFEEVAVFLKNMKPNNVTDEEIDTFSTNFSQVLTLINSIFSDFYAKRGTVLSS